jgi:hypothetical protein
MCGIVLPDFSLVTDTAFPSQWTTLVVQNTDLGHTSNSRGTHPPTVPGSLSVPTIRGNTNNHKTPTPRNAGTVFATALLGALAKQLPSSQEKRGDDKLERTRQMVDEFVSTIQEHDRRTIEDKILQ